MRGMKRELDLEKLRSAMFTLCQTSEIAANLRGQFTRPFWAEAALTLLSIKLNDVLQFLKENDSRVSFRDPTDIASGDVTDYVNNIRNVCCHISSPESKMFKSHIEVLFATVMPGDKAHFNFPEVAGGTEIVHENPYKDDKLFFYGQHRIFLERHLIRAIKEARMILTNIAKINSVPTSVFDHLWCEI